MVIGASWKVNGAPTALLAPLGVPLACNQPTMQ